MFIKHKTFRDVAIETNSLAYGKCLGRGVNLGYTKSWYLPCKTEYVEIKDRGDWERCVNPAKVHCLRYAEWVSL